MDRENRCRGLGCRLSEEPKKLAESLDAYFRIFGGRRWVILSWWNFAYGVGVPDVIIHANFGDDRFRGFWGSGVEFPTFPLTCVVVLKTLWHYCASVWFWSSLVITALSVVKKYAETLTTGLKLEVLPKKWFRGIWETEIFWISTKRIGNHISWESTLVASVFGVSDQLIQSVSLAVIIHTEASVSSATQFGHCCSLFLCCCSETLELSSTELLNCSIR